jgi:excisionase family DNA binding protein
MAEIHSNAHHPLAERTSCNISQFGHGRQWLDLKALTQYASVSDRTMRQWIHRAADPLPAVRVGTKILVRRSAFDRWLETHKLETADVSGIVDKLVSDLVSAD